MSLRRFALALALLFVTSPALAAPPLEEAQAEMELGVELAGRGRYEEALEHYRRAQRIIPQANLPWRYAAEAHEKLAQWQEAVDAYRRYLAIKPDARDAADVKARIARIEDEHLVARLSVITTPGGAEVFVDGRLEGVTPRTIVLDAGAHTVRLHHVRHVDVDLSIVTAGGRTTTIERTLVQRSAPSPIAPIAVATGATLLTAALATDVILLADAKRDFDRARNSGDRSALAESERVDVLNALVLGGYAVGAVLTFAGLGLFLLPTKKDVQVVASPTSGALRLRF